MSIIFNDETSSQTIRSEIFDILWNFFCESDKLFNKLTNKPIENSDKDTMIYYEVYKRICNKSGKDYLYSPDLDGINDSNHIPNPILMSDLIERDIHCFIRFDADQNQILDIGHLSLKTCSKRLEDYKSSEKFNDQNLEVLKLIKKVDNLLKETVIQLNNKFSEIRNRI